MKRGGELSALMSTYGFKETEAEAEELKGAVKENKDKQGDGAGAANGGPEKKNEGKRANGLGGKAPVRCCGLVSRF